MQVGQQVGPFAIEQMIGAGAMGTVYRARYTKTGQEVALKIIAGGHDTKPTALARFEREAEILKKLSHPGIVRLFAHGRYKGTPFYVMEFIQGHSLEEELQRRRRFSWEEIVDLGQQICAALQHAHEKGIVHRDLKPANVMMTPEGVAKLTDFGIAKGVEATQLTATNCTVGTASYMSPEQCRGERNLTHKSDLYSLGVMFYELLTGRRPFLAENTLDMFLAHTEGKFERPSRLVLDIPVWLDTLVCQLMEKDPEKRPFDAAMVAQALDSIQEKIAAQRSAGVELVTARRMDVPRGQRPKDETDLEAARTLREAATKKKVKRKRRPFYERGWFQAVAISALLLGVGGLVAYVLRPPAPDKLYEQAKYWMDSKEPKEWSKARDGPIKKFLDHYADRTDAQAMQMRAWADQVDTALREEQLHNRLRMQMSPDDEAERLAYSAVKFEEAGDLDGALHRWQDLEKLKDAADADQRLWGLLAGKRMRDLRDVDDREKHWRDRVEQARLGIQELKPDTETDGWIATALRAEMFGDAALALKNWRKLKDTYHKDLAQRTWLLLAAKKVRVLAEQAPRGSEEQQVRRELVQKKIEQAESLKGDKIGEARALCRDILSLYDKTDDPEVNKRVGEARKLLAELTAKP
jgi:serine/threonine-protein kinase